jgi:hypothetical protein
MNNKRKETYDEQEFDIKRSVKKYKKNDNDVTQLSIIELVTNSDCMVCNLVNIKWIDYILYIGYNKKMIIKQ